jgi:hypothetical protein
MTADRGEPGQDSMRDLAQGMLTPTTAGGTLALFAGLELAEVEEGRQTLGDARDTLRMVVKDASPGASTPKPPRELGESAEDYETRIKFR